MTGKIASERVIIISLIVVVALVLFPAFFVGFGMMGFGPVMGGTWGGGMMAGWMFVAGIVMQFLFLATLLGGGYLVYRAVTGGESDTDRALEELRLAYARGELTDEEYEHRREELERDTESR